MPPKKAAGKKKKVVELSEPEHDPAWERAVESGTWDKPPTDLPEANTWPTWGALRERVLINCKEMRIANSAAVRDAFLVEVVKLSPPELTTLVLPGSTNLTRVTLSPLGSCPKLAKLDLSDCPKLHTVLLQSTSLTHLKLAGCRHLVKAIIHCPNLEQLDMGICSGLQELMLWSNKLSELDITASAAMTKRALYCPHLQVSKVTVLLPRPRPERPVHPPIAELMKEQNEKLAKVKQQEIEKHSLLPGIPNLVIAAYNRPLV